MEDEHCLSLDSTLARSCISSPYLMHRHISSSALHQVFIKEIGTELREIGPQSKVKDRIKRLDHSLNRVYMHTLRNQQHYRALEDEDFNKPTSQSW
nr:hypothetical protein BgiMline_017193 [Biomphalaria glabrata]